MAIDLEQLEQKMDQGQNVATQKVKLRKVIEKLEQVSTVSIKEKIFFIQNLQVMLRSGLPLDKSLKGLSEQTKNKRFKLILDELANNTQKGISLSESLKKHQKLFGDLFINMVEAGETSGRLEDVLKQLYLQTKKLYELRNKVISAMIYPVIVTLAMIVIAIGMMIFVVPKISTIFDQLNAELPVATKALISISNFIVNNGLLTFLIVVLAIGLVIFTYRYKKTKNYYHWLFLHLPIFGPIVKKINLARFARTLSSLIKTDIPIVKSFQITAEILGNNLYRSSLLNSVETVRGGKSLTEVLKAYPELYPPVTVQMTSAGEETGTVDEVLSELAGFYEDEVDEIMKSLPAVIEPVLILILAVGVGLMAAAIILPMYNLSQYVT